MVWFFMAFLTTGNSYSQEETELPDSGYHKNVIKWNITPFILINKKNLNFSYERILSPYRSFSINGGIFLLPKLALLDSFRIERVNKKSGFNLSGDYRFYFKDRNKNIAPDGLYLGIFSSYYHTKIDMNISVINNPDFQGSLIFNGKFDAINTGVELGYQFVLKDRFTFDMIFVGPSLALYNKYLTFDEQIQAEDYEQYLQAIYDILVNTFPGFDKLIENGLLNVNDARMHFGFGFRYLFQIGYRF